MPRRGGRPYTQAEREAAVALSRQVGLKPAAKLFGLSHVTLIGWRRAAEAAAAPEFLEVDALEHWTLTRYGPDADRWLGVVCHLLADLPDETLPDDPVSWAAAAIGPAPSVAEWHELHACPHLKAPVPYTLPPLDPDLAALVAEAETLMETL